MDLNINQMSEFNEGLKRQVNNLEVKLDNKIADFQVANEATYKSCKSNNDDCNKSPEVSESFTNIQTVQQPEESFKWIQE